MRKTKKSHMCLPTHRAKPRGRKEPPGGRGEARTQTWEWRVEHWSKTMRALIVVSIMVGDH